MVNVPKEWGPEYLRDIAALNYWWNMNERHPGDKKILQSALDGLQRVGRDNARTPVQWSTDEHAGFSTAEPWIRVHDNYKEVNVAAQQKEHDDILVHGQFEIFDIENLNTFAYLKDYEGKLAFAALNFSNEEQAFDIPLTLKDRKLNLLMKNVDGLGDKLSPWEGRAYLVE
jgi:alpha-glucosidase